MRDKREARTLKEALYNTIHHHPTLSVEAIAEELGMAASYLYRSATPDPDTDGPNASGVRFPAKQLVPLIRVTSDYQTLDYMERALGRVAVVIPSPDNTDLSKELCRCALKAGAEFGQLMQAVEGAMDDGVVSEAERTRIAKEGWEAIQAIMAVVAKCEQ